MAFNPSEYANNGAGRDIAQFHKVVTGIVEYRNAEFVRDLNSKSLAMRLQGATDLQIQQFEDDAHADRTSRSTGFRVRAPLPQTDFAQQQNYQAETDISTEAGIKRDAAREAGYANRPRTATAEDKEASTMQDIQSYSAAVQDAIARGADPFQVRTRLQKHLPKDVYERAMRPFFRQELREAGDDPEKYRELLKNWPEFRTTIKGIAPEDLESDGPLG